MFNSHNGNARRKCLFAATALSTLVLLGSSVSFADPPLRSPAARAAQGKPQQVTVDAYWLRLTPSQLTPGQSTIAPALLADSNVLYARARVVGFDGQSVTVEVNRSAGVVVNATPVVAPGVVAYNADIETRTFGVKLTETSTISTEDSALELAVDFSVTMQPEKPAAHASTQPTTEPFNLTNPVSVNAAGEVVGTAVVQIHTQTTVRVQPGVPTVVSGMSDHPGSADGRTLCLVICASVDGGAKK